MPLSSFSIDIEKKKSLVCQVKVHNNFLKRQKLLQMENPFSNQTVRYFGEDYLFYTTFSLKFL